MRLAVPHFWALAYLLWSRGVKPLVGDHWLKETWHKSLNPSLGRLMVVFFFGCLPLDMPLHQSRGRWRSLLICPSEVNGIRYVQHPLGTSPNVRESLLLCHRELPYPLNMGTFWCREASKFWDVDSNSANRSVKFQPFSEGWKGTWKHSRMFQKILLRTHHRSKNGGEFYRNKLITLTDPPSKLLNAHAFSKSHAMILGRRTYTFLWTLEPHAFCSGWSHFHWHGDSYVHTHHVISMAISILREVWFFLI